MPVTIVQRQCNQGLACLDTVRIKLDPAARGTFGGLVFLGIGGNLHGTLRNPRILGQQCSLQVVRNGDIHFTTLTGNLGQQNIEHHVIREGLLRQCTLRHLDTRGGWRIILYVP